MVRENSNIPLLRRGFSLVELLAVMAVVAVLLSMASVGINNMGKAQGLTSGVSISEAMFAQARSLAIGQGTYTRVVIHANLNDEDDLDRKRYRKMMVIMQRGVDQRTGELDQVWKAAAQPVFLPDQVYYGFERSSTDIDTSGRIPEAIHRLGKGDNDEVNTYYYEFNPQGVCTTPGASFILEAGARPPGSEKAILGKERSYGGFVVSRNGGTLTIRDISKLQEPQ